MLEERVIGGTERFVLGGARGKWRLGQVTFGCPGVFLVLEREMVHRELVPSSLKK